MADDPPVLVPPPAQEPDDVIEKDASTTEVFKKPVEI
jgi:hypothetical protein